MNNLHQLDLALVAHCYPPVTEYPTDLAELNTNDVTPELFVCPVSHNEPGALSNTMEWTDYIYVSGLNPTVPEGVPVLICPPMFHQTAKGKGATVLDTDHSTQWVTDTQLVDQLIENPLLRFSNGVPSTISNLYVHVSPRIEQQSKGRYRSHTVPLPVRKEEP